MRYRVNYKRLLGKPDIVFTKLKVVVFVMEISGMDIIGLSEVSVVFKKNYQGILSIGETRY